MTIKKGTIPGVILIAVGLIIFLGNLNVMEGELTLIILGLGFYFIYFLSERDTKGGAVGFLIPANILLMLGIFVMLENMLILGKLSGTLFFVMIGTAFLLIYLIHSQRYGQQWSLITALALYGFSIFIFLVEYLDSPIVRFTIKRFWPVVLIILGLLFIIRGSKNNSK